MGETALTVLHWLWALAPALLWFAFIGWCLWDWPTEYGRRHHGQDE